MEFKSYIKNLLKDADISEEYRDLLTEPEPLKKFQNAFTHISYDPDNNYEVLEFIGDGIVKAVNSQYIPKRFAEVLKNFPSKSGTGEGAFSKTRRYFEQSKFQYPIAIDLGMWKYVRADDDTKNTKRNKTLEDVFEAFIGALTENIDEYIYDGFGYIFAKKFLVKQLDKQEITITEEILDDPITRLNELYKANEIKGGGQLKWGDAKYVYTKLILPRFKSLPDPREFRDRFVFNSSDDNAYFSTGTEWIHPAAVPIGKTIKNTEATVDPREDKDLFQTMYQPMTWAVVYGKPNGRDQIVGQGLAFVLKKAKMTAASNALKYLKNMGIEK